MRCVLLLFSDIFLLAQPLDKTKLGNDDLGLINCNMPCFFLCLFFSLRVFVFTLCAIFSSSSVTSHAFFTLLCACYTLKLPGCLGHAQALSATSFRTVWTMKLSRVQVTWTEHVPFFLRFVTRFAGKKMKHKIFATIIVHRMMEFHVKLVAYNWMPKRSKFFS